MKKLNLGKLKLVAEDVLQRSQMARIYGGSDYCANAPGTCGYKDPGGYTVCNLSLSTVLCYVNKYGGNYCCDSCGEGAGYCP